MLELLDSEQSSKAVFSVVEHSGKHEICCVGTAVVISPQCVLTTWTTAHKSVTPGNWLRSLIFEKVLSLMASPSAIGPGAYRKSDLVRLTIFKANEAENWCVLRRDKGEFEYVAPLCLEAELPAVQDDVFVHDGLVEFEYSRIVSRKSYVEWYHRRGANFKKRRRVLCASDSESDYDCAFDHQIKKKQKVEKKDEDTKNAKEGEEMPAPAQSLDKKSTKEKNPHLQAVRVYARSTDSGQSAGCPMLTAKGQLFAMRTDSSALVLCRLPQFMKWFNNPTAESSEESSGEEEDEEEEKEEEEEEDEEEEEEE